MSEAIASSGISPKEIDYINVHGTGTPDNDASEGMALRRIFGEHVPPFSSVKAFIGHTLGASEGIEAVYSVLSIDKGLIYPNLNFTDAMPETGLIPETSFQEGIPSDMCYPTLSVSRKRFIAPLFRNEFSSMNAPLSI